jgi:hypothetical protein
MRPFIRSVPCHPNLYYLFKQSNFIGIVRHLLTARHPSLENDLSLK